MPNYDRKIILSCSDFHSGHELGLANPETLLQRDEGDVPIEINEGQAHLWGVIEGGIEEVKKLAEKDEVIVIHHGDVCQGNGHLTTKVSNRIADDVAIACANFDPIASITNVKSIRIAKGTGAHSFEFGSAEVLVAEHLKTKYQKDVQTVYHGLSTLPSGFTIDYAHHGPSAGRRNWLQGNEARYYLRDIMMNDLQAGDTPPDLVLRGHYHTLVTEILWMRDHGNRYKSMLAVTPSMCLLDDFATKVTKSQARIVNGILAFEIIDNRIYDVHEFCVTLDIRTKETI